MKSFTLLVSTYTLLYGILQIADNNNYRGIVPILLAVYFAARVLTNKQLSWWNWNIKNKGS
jgi:inner membrane protein involved in colicin E2 resistance